jgi:hypothetical protein
LEVGAVLRVEDALEVVFGRLAEGIATENLESKQVRSKRTCKDLDPTYKY